MPDHILLPLFRILLTGVRHKNEKYGIVFNREKCRDVNRSLLSSRKTPDSLLPLFHHRGIVVLVTALCLFCFYCLTASASASNQVTINGLFSTIWGDSFTDLPSSRERHFLSFGSGNVAELIIDPSVAKAAGGLRRLNGEMVSVTATAAISNTSQRNSSNAPLLVQHLEKLSFTGKTMSRAAATGNQPWVSIMCKFPDISAEPKNLQYFQDMYASAHPGLNHYWKQASYNRVNLDGSTAFGWYVLPQPRSYYIQGGNLNLAGIAEDCTRQADADVFFPAFMGINLMFNFDLDGYAWGGSQFLDIDGRRDVYRMTWEPPWGYSSLTVIAHEMGHGFGMPHSSGNYGNTYDNVWDVMSDPWANCNSATDPVYGCLGQHTIAYHRRLVGWLRDEEVFTFDGTTRTITLERLTLPTTSHYRLAKVPISNSNSRYYTIEVRHRVGYDTKLPAEAVIIHEVDEMRANGRDAHVIDIDNNGRTGDEGAIWRVGETFTDHSNSICIKVVAKVGNAYSIQIGCGSAASSPSAAPPSIHLLLLRKNS